jgi:hypothetical protein
LFELLGVDRAAVHFAASQGKLGLADFERIAEDVRQLMDALLRPEVRWLSFERCAAGVEWHGPFKLPLLAF